MNFEQLQKLDQQHHLHPFTNHLDMYAQQGTYIMESAEGVHVKDMQGKTLIDGLAGLWCVNVGYGRKEIIDAVQKQMTQLAYYPSFFNTTTEATILLANRITSYAPERLTHAFFSNSGSEANETAIKLIRAYHKIKNTPTKTKILTIGNGYHGVTLATTSMTQLPSCQTPFDLPIPGFVQVPGPYTYGANTTMNHVEYGQWCLRETEKIIAKEGADTIAALFAEPVQGAGGVMVHPEGYLHGLREICRKNSILFVADEVITAFGRVGDWFASKLWNLDPDLLTTAKGITSGYIPLGATLVSREVTATLIQGGYLAHGCTYSGHPVACAAALANLDIIEKEKLIPRTRDITGPYFQKKLREFANHPAVGEVRGVGLIGAMELLPRGGKAMLNSKTPLGPKAMKIGREEGVVVRGIRDILAVAPPLVISESEIDELFAGIQRVLNRLWE
jgi:putrescine aminotransferase